jgi:hypothetical protein
MNFFDNFLQITMSQLFSTARVAQVVILFYLVPIQGYNYLFLIKKAHFVVAIF